MSVETAGYDPRRWRVLILSAVINTCIGFCYAWSVLQSAFIEEYHWELKYVSLAFTVLMALSSFLQFIGGKAMEKFSCRSIVFVGGILLGVGAFALGMANTLPFLYGAGCVFGLGMALIYPCTVSNTGKFFPDKPGLVSGLMAAGMGSGAVIWAPLASALMNHFSVGSTLKMCGILFLLIVCISAIFIVDAGKEAGGGMVAEASRRDRTWKQMLKEGRFYLIAAILVIGGSSGMMVMSHASMIAQESMGVAAAQAAVIVGVLSAFNTVGRVFWGTLSDKFGRPAIVAVVFVTLIAAMLLLSAGISYGLTLAAMLLVGCAYGGLMGMISSLTSDLFGFKNLSTNFSIMFMTVGVSSIVGPQVAALVKTATSSYSTAFLLAGILSAAALVLSLMFIRLQRK